MRVGPRLGRPGRGAVGPRPGAVPEDLGRRVVGAEGELRLITTVTSFATAVDVTLAELKLEAFLPADDATAEILRDRARARADRAAARAAEPGADAHVPAPR